MAANATQISSHNVQSLFVAIAVGQLGNLRIRQPLCALRAVLGFRQARDEAGGVQKRSCGAMLESVFFISLNPHSSLHK
jgi:hypothetical protein